MDTQTGSPDPSPRQKTRHRATIFFRIFIQTSEAVFTILLEKKREYAIIVNSKFYEMQVPAYRLQSEQETGGRYKMSEIYDIAILGAGPAGISATFMRAGQAENSVAGQTVHSGRTDPEYL